MTTILVLSLIFSLWLAIIFYWLTFTEKNYKSGFWVSVALGGPFIWALTLIILSALGITKLVRLIRGH
jgi:hypothetical protein